MRSPRFVLVMLAVVLVSACDFWPKDLDALAERIGRQVSGKSTALLLGDVVVINVTGSPLFREPQAALRAVATDIAEQAIESAPAPIEGIAITFYEDELSSDKWKMRDFIFLVTENGPILQPYLDANATGPLNQDEIEAAIDRLGDTLTKEQLDCAMEGQSSRLA